jgi:NitT/TauT family transport system substrate-binding protein
MRKLLLTAISLALITQSAAAAEKIIYQLGWLPGGDKAAVYIGVHQGLFKAAGLDVTILPGRGSTDVITKVATGIADLGESGLGSLMIAKVESDVRVVAIMSIFTKQPDVLLTVKGGPIKTLKDVSGKTIATSPASSSNVTWPIVLSQNGIDPASVRILNSDPATLGGLLATGRVDGVINWITSSAGTNQALAQLGKQMEVLSWSEYGYAGYANSIIAATKTLKERPEVVRKFLEVYRRAEEILRDDPQAGVKAVMATVPEADAKGLLADAEAAVPLIFNEVTTKNGLGNFDPKLVDATWEWTAKSQKLPLDKIKPATLIDTSFLR